MAKGKIEKRGSKKRNIRPIILIVTEGSKTEPTYFEHFRNRHTNIDIRIVGSRSNGGETDYLSLLKKAKEIQDNNQLRKANGDSIWILADADVNFNGSEVIRTKNNRLQELRKLAARSEIEILISNPCFELWYLLHFKYTTKFFRDYSAVKTELVSYISGYEKTEDVYPLIASRTTDAVQNSRKLEQYHVTNGETTPLPLSSNPFTEVYRLVELLIKEQ